MYVMCMLACKVPYIFLLRWAERPSSEKRSSASCEELQSSGFELNGGTKTYKAMQEKDVCHVHAGMQSDIYLSPEMGGTPI